MVKRVAWLDAENIVTNISLREESLPLPSGCRWIADEETCAVGMVWNGSSYEIIPDPPKTDEELATEKQANIDAIFASAEEYVDRKGTTGKGRVSKYSIGILTLKGNANTPKSKAIMDWVNSVFLVAYTREAQVNGGMPFTPEMLDFSSCGPMPHTVAEALQEA